MITFYQSITGTSTDERRKKRAAQIQALRAMIRADKDDFSCQVHTMALEKLEKAEEGDKK